MSDSDFYSKWMPRALSVLRIIAAFLLMQHGAQKVFGVLVPTPPPGAPSSHGTFSLFSLEGVACGSGADRWRRIVNNLDTDGDDSSRNCGYSVVCVTVRPLESKWVQGSYN